LGDALARQGKSAEAIKPYQRALQLDPDNAEVHKNLGNALLQNGQADEAIAQYRSAVEIKPDYAEARYNLAVALGLEGKLDEAIEQYRKTVEIKPDYADAHGNLARMLAAQGKLDEAVQEYQRTLALAPDSAQAHFRYGQTLQAQHHFAAAKAEYQKALELESKHLPARLSLAWLLATCPDQSLRDGAGAVELMKQVRTLAGNELPQFLDTLAAAYAETGRFDRAVETAKQALNLPATQDDKPLAEAIQSRLKLYEAHLPYRETP
jgi:tetratricopeptide (TPR) repeat protein